MEDATVFAKAGSPACGDMITMYLKVEVVAPGEEVLSDVSFESYGCAANIAASSLLTEMVKGMRLKEAWNVSWRKLSDELGGLPEIKHHCSILAVGALKRAIRKYYDEVRKALPAWLPRELTADERQALEEEELIEKLYGRMKLQE